MIHSLSVKNFRCFKSLEVDRCSRVNVIVGDNGVGKTALLESIFFPLSTTTEVGARMRAMRGLDGSFNGAPHRIENAIWGGFFYENDLDNAVSLRLTGDGVEARSLRISREPANEDLFQSLTDGHRSRQSSLTFEWKDAGGKVYKAIPSVTDQGLSFPSTGENMDNFFFFSANQTIGSVENASRFSELSQNSSDLKFVKLFASEYQWIKSIDVEVYGGSPVLFASFYDGRKKQPLPNVSSGINRTVGFLLSMAVSNGGVVIVDEIENGIHYSHLVGLWKLILLFSREYKCQLFISTHSQECLMALAKAVGKNWNNISLWQLDKRGVESKVNQFTGDDLRLALEYHEEIR